MKNRADEKAYKERKMDAKLVVLLCLVAVAVNVYAAPPPGGMDKKLDAEDSVCGLVGRSGKIVCHKVLKGKCDGEDDDMTTEAPKDDKKNNSTEEGDKSGEKDDKDKCYKTHPVEISLDKITELNSDNETVDSKHAYNSFASQDFTLSDPVDDVSIPNAGDLKGKKISMTITLDNKATITIDVYLIKGEGTVEMDGEEIEVKKGMLKFSISMTNWTWCGEKQGVTDINESCGDKTGTQLEVHFEVKSRGKPKPKDREGKRGKRFELGGDALMELSEKVSIR